MGQKKHLKKIVGKKQIDLVIIVTGTSNSSAKNFRVKKGLVYASLKNGGKKGKKTKVYLQKDSQLWLKDIINAIALKNESQKQLGKTKIPEILLK